MNYELQQRISKIYEMVKRGTEAEQAVAKTKLDAILAKYNLNDLDLDNIDKMERQFSYATELEVGLLYRIVKFLIEDSEAVKSVRRYPWKPKHVKVYLKYADFITVDCAYEYFRRHMNDQWKKFCRPELDKCRKAKTRNKRREELKEIFFNRYIIESKLYDATEIEEVDPDKMSRKEYKDRLKMRGIEGGKYNRQMHTGLLLEN